MPSRMSWRDAGRGILKGLSGRLNQRPEPAPEPAAPPVAAPVRPAKVTVEERATAFMSDVWSITVPQLETLIVAWDGIEPAAREAALDQARPSLTAADRKDLFTEVREELRRWQAGESQHEGGPAHEIPSTVRLRASRVLLDAAVATIAQDRMAKRHFEVLYAPFRTALTGDPMHLPQRATVRPGKPRPVAGQDAADEAPADAEEAASTAEPAAAPEAAPETESSGGAAKPATHRSHARHAAVPEKVEHPAAPTPEAESEPPSPTTRRRTNHGGQS